MAKIDEVLAGIKLLNIKLYGENGFEGDISEIKKHLKNNNKRLRKVEIILAGLIGSGLLGGGAVGIIRLLGG